MAENHLLALNIVFWLSAALVIVTLYATHKSAEPAPADYRIAITQEVEV